MVLKRRREEINCNVIKCINYVTSGYEDIKPSMSVEEMNGSN